MTHRELVGRSGHDSELMLVPLQAVEEKPDLPFVLPNWGVQFLESYRNNSVRC